MHRKLASLWARFWLAFAGRSPLGRLAARLATWSTPPYKGNALLAWMNKRGFVSPSATIYHGDLRLGDHVYIGDRVIIYQEEGGGPVELGTFVSLFGDSLIETGPGGSVTIGAGSRVHRGCQLVAYKAPIHIGCEVGIAQNCTFYSYDHGMAPGRWISEQPLVTRGPITVGDHAWLGVGVIVLNGVRIGSGAVIGAGAVVTRDIPDGAIAVGVPARVVKMRSDISRGEAASS